MRRGFAVGAAGILVLSILAVPALAQTTEHRDAMTRLSDRLKAMQSTLGGGKLYDTIDPGETAPYPSVSPDSSYSRSGYAARGFLEVYRRMGAGAPAGMLDAAKAAFDGAFSANGTGITYGDVLTGLELGVISPTTYLAQRTGATATLKAIAAGTGMPTAATIAAKIITDAVADQGGSVSAGAWEAGHAAIAFSRVGSTIMTGTVTGAAIASEIASQLDTSYGATAFTADASPFYLLGWSGIALALAATGTDPTTASANYLALIVSTKSGDGLFDEEVVYGPGGANTDLFEGTAYGIMALRAAIDAGYIGWQYDSSAILGAGNALADQVNQEFTVYGVIYGFPGYTGAGFVEYDPGYPGGPYVYGTTGYVEFGQFDGEGLFGIAASTPEPGTFALFGLGLLGIGAAARRRRRRGARA